MPCAYLERAGSILDVVTECCCDCFADDASGGLSYTYRSNSWAFIRCDQATKVVQCLRAVAAKASQRSADADLNEVHSRFQGAVSRPEGPVAPSILRTVLRISCPSILSKRTVWGSVVCISPVTIDDI